MQRVKQQQQQHNTKNTTNGHNDVLIQKSPAGECRALFVNTPSL